MSGKGVNSTIIIAIVISAVIGATVAGVTTYLLIGGEEQTTGGEQPTGGENEGGQLATFPTGVGQSVTYGVYEDGTKTATDTLTVTENVTFKGHSMIKVRWEGEAVLYSWYVDENGRTWYVWSDYYEMDNEDREMTFDHDAGNISGRYIETGVENTVGMPSNFTVIFSIFHGKWWEAQNLSVGQKTTFTRIGMEDTGEILLRVTEFDVVSEVSPVTVPAGEFDAYAIDPSGEGAEFTHIWIDKETNIPVKFKTSYETMKLESYSGL